MSGTACNGSEGQALRASDTLAGTEPARGSADVVAHQNGRTAIGTNAGDTGAVLSATTAATTMAQLGLDKVTVGAAAGAAAGARIDCDKADPGADPAKPVPEHAGNPINSNGRGEKPIESNLPGDGKGSDQGNTSKGTNGTNPHKTLVVIPLGANHR